MFLSKIWFILIALVSAVAGTFALVAPRPAVQKLAVLEGQRLDRAQYAAEQMFKVDAHKWIDRVSKLGRDAILSESLDAASRGSGEYTVIHRTIQDRFKTLIPDLATGGIDEIVALDNKGRVIARVGGSNEKEYGDYIGGVEVVADALRGYLSDDVWGVGGQLERVAGAPVLSKGKDRIVGAIYVGAETGPGLVERLKKNLDVDVALLLRGKVIASSRPPGELDALPEMVTQHVSEMAELKRTPALPLTVGQDKLLAVAAPFPGQAGEQQAYYALLGMQPAKTDLGALLSNVSSNDLKWGNFPWVPLALVTFAMIAIGLILQRVEVEAPLGRLRRELQKLAAGDLQKIDDHKYGGKYGGLARDVNAAVERFTHAPGARSEMAGKDLNAILGPSGGNTFDLPSAGSAFSGSTPAPAFNPPPAAPSFSSPPAPGFPPPPPPGGFAPPPLPSFSAPPAPSFSAPSLPQPFSAAGLGSSSSPLLPLPSSIKPAPWAQQLPADAIDDGNADASRQMPEGEATRVVPYDLQEEEDAHFRHVFDDFVETKRSCGEPTAGLTQAKFLQKLRDNKSALVAKHACRTVRFSVYVKDGKAALRATPIRE
ncbi:MAG TPA: MXAN_5187 family protein [Polyangia bacterium]|nr:MXAN_5187 family protein [Polyangia bacterium]